MDRLTLGKSMVLACCAATLVFLRTPSVEADTRTGAMVLDVLGLTAPQVEPFAMLNAGTRLVLEPSSELEFVHLSSCELVRIRGGVLTVRARGFTAAGGDVLMRTDEDCPKKARLRAETRTTGIRFRSINQTRPVLFPERPSLVLPDGDVARLTISLKGGETTVIDVAVSGAVVAWPPSRPGLTRGREYVLAVTIGDDVLSTVFKVRADGGDSRLPVVLSLD